MKNTSHQTIDNFLAAYRDAFTSIPGYFTFDAALVFMAYNQLNRAEGIIGNVLEIGVHHGLSAITVAALAGSGRRFFAVDLFDEMQDKNCSQSGSGNRQEFLRNMEKFFTDLNFLEVITGPSSEIRPTALGKEFSFCHIDGGHSPEETYCDLELCSSILMPGGLVALDDYFNPSFPGVSEGAVKFFLEHSQELQPVAIGFNKILLQKSPVLADLNHKFTSEFGLRTKERPTMWGHRVNYFTSSLQPLFDSERSSPHSIVRTERVAILATFEPAMTSISAKPSEIVQLPVKIFNTSAEEFPYGESIFGLSYHLLSSSGAMVKFDNKRCYFTQPLQPGDHLMTKLEILAPGICGKYEVELDLVWENKEWFEERGNPTVTVELDVEY